MPARPTGSRALGVLLGRRLRDLAHELQLSCAPCTKQKTYGSSQNHQQLKYVANLNRPAELSLTAVALTSSRWRCVFRQMITRIGPVITRIGGCDQPT